MSQSHDLFWAHFFGMAVAEFGTSGSSVVPHAGLAGYRGVWFFRHSERLVVSAPVEWLPRIRSHIGELAESSGFPSQSALLTLFGRDLERCVGPAFHGSLDGPVFRPILSEQVRALTDADAPAASTFRAACGSGEWQDSGLDEAELHRAAYFENDTITAMAGFRPWGPGAGDPCVLTHPAHRGSGRGRRVVSHVIRAALEQGFTLLYQTLESNVASVKLALGLGYQRYANHLAVGLASDRPSS